MSIEQAIQKAIEGGWQLPDRLKDGWIESLPLPESIYYIFLDPLFWQSLGKAMGWKCENDRNCKEPKHSWLYHWHRFIDHLAEGHSAEEFFRELEEKK